MASYTELALTALTSAIDGNKTAPGWLKQHKFLGLLAFHNALVHKSEEAADWLKRSKDPEIYLLYLAVEEESTEAVQFLLRLNHTPMAFTANAVLGDRKAWKWLEANNHAAHYELARAITEFYNREIDSSLNSYS